MTPDDIRRELGILVQAHTGDQWDKVPELRIPDSDSYRVTGWLFREVRTAPLKYPRDYVPAGLR